LSRKKENLFSELTESMSYVYRHRSGINLFGKQIDQLKIGQKVVYLDNHIPGPLMETFDNLGYEQKDGTKPLLAEKRKTNTGWHLVINLPPGVSFNQVKKDKDFFQEA